MDTREKKPEVIPQQHNWLSRKLLSAPIQPIPDRQPKSKIENNWIARYSFSWLNHILRVGYDRALDQNDIPQLAKRDAIEQRIDEYHAFLARRPEEKPYKEIKALLYAFRKTILFTSIVQAIAYGSSVAQSVISRKLIAQAELLAENGSRVSHGPATGYTIANTVLNILSISGQLFAEYSSTIMTREIRILAIAAIHEKAMSLSPQQRMDLSVGKITSILSSDTERGAQALMFFSELIVFPFYFAAVLGVLIYNIGVSALVGLALLIGAISFNAAGAALAGKLRLMSMPFQDKRVSLTRETVKNMSIIKFYGWENSFREVIDKVRVSEMRYIRLVGLVISFVNCTILTAPVFAGALAFVVRIVTGNHLSPAIAFPSLTLFNMFVPIFITLTQAMTSSADAWVACKRMNTLFRLPSVSSYISSLDPNDSVNDGVVFRVTNAEVAWKLREDQSDDEDANSHEKSGEARRKKQKKTKKKKKDLRKSATQHKDDGPVAEEEEKVVLSDINVTVNDGSLVLVVGPVGSGKTSLLSIFAGTVPLKQGEVAKRDGKEVSCALSHWTRNANIRDNILFGRDWDPDLYDRVLHICALDSDLDQLADGDFTEVGENGVTLSGGQRARIALARCLYANCDIILLDDILSAMDARVQNFIFRELMKLVRSEAKTIVFATNNLAFLPSADSVVSLDGQGHCTQAKPDDVHLFFRPQSEDDQDASEIDDEQQKSESGEVSIENEGQQQANDIRKNRIASDEAALVYAESVRTAQVSGRVKTPGVRNLSVFVEDEEHSPKTLPKAHAQAIKVSETLVRDETKATGTVSMQVIIDFLQLNKLSGALLVLAFAFVACVYGAASAMSNVILNWWTDNSFRTSQGFYIGMYLLSAGVSSSAFVLFASFIPFYCTKATTILFGKAINGVYGAPLSFFQETPLGRIMTRFTTDVVNLDTLLVSNIRGVFMSLMSFLGSIIVVFVYVPWSVLCLLPIIMLSLLFIAFYRTSSRDLNRIKQLWEGKIMSTISENIEGQEVICAFNQQGNAESLLIERSNQYVAAVMCNDGSHYWIALRDAILCEMLTLVSIFLAVFQVFKLGGSEVGLLISSLSTAAASLPPLFPMFALAENQFNSVERLNEYAYDIPTEQNAKSEDPRLSEWKATEGAIEFKDVCLKYRPNMPLALNHLSFSISGGKRLGVCGRTGAGKSTLVSALFRLVELCGGDITIDGESIQTIPVAALRRELSIIPQQPVLFQGTIRSNLDPFGEYSDQELWDALHKAGGLPDRDGTKFHLDSMVDPEGSNFSLGERQLLSLSRALVRKSKILILDEATAAVDEAMDEMVQTVIKTHFKERTIICIAHRLMTIMDYDDILLMAPGGKVLEMGTPSELLEMDGEFASLAKEAGII